MTTDAAPKAKPKSGCLPVVLLIVGLAIVAAIIGSLVGGGSSADLHVRATSVVPLDASTVRIYYQFTNTGKAAGGVQCEINTTVNNKFGDQVNIEVNSIGTNKDVRPGGVESQYQDIGVNSGDAAFVALKDVQFANC